MKRIRLALGMKRRDQVNALQGHERIQEILEWELACGHASNFGRRFMYDHLQERGYHIFSQYA